MPKGRQAQGKKVAPAPAVVKKQVAKEVVNPLFEKRPKNFGQDFQPKRDHTCGQDFQPKRDFTHVAKWPCYIWLQRQRAVLYKRLKVPHALTSLPRPWTPKGYATAEAAPQGQPRGKAREAEVVGLGCKNSCQPRGCPHPEPPCPWSRVLRISTLVENTWPAGGDSTQRELHQAGALPAHPVPENGIPHCISKGRPGWGGSSTGRPSPPWPSHRLSGKRELWLSWWRHWDQLQGQMR